MQNDKDKQPSQPNKSMPGNVSGESIADTKEKTDPLAQDENISGDEREGKMDNGELGAGLKKSS